MFGAIAGGIASALSFFFVDTATTDIYTLSLHDALPIFGAVVAIEGERKLVRRLNRHDDRARAMSGLAGDEARVDRLAIEKVQNEITDFVVADGGQEDRKSTRLNSSH